MGKTVLVRRQSWDVISYTFLELSDFPEGDGSRFESSGLFDPGGHRCSFPGKVGSFAKVLSSGLFVCG